MKKNNYMNLVKAFGIIAMVIGHSSHTYVPIIYQYHMALFFFASGYFYKKTDSEYPIKYFIKKIKTNYLTYVKYSFLFLLFRNIFLRLFIYSSNDFSNHDILHTIKAIITLNYGEPLTGTFWFLITLFYVSILYNTISYISYKITPKNNNELKLIIVVVLFLYGFLTLNYSINLFELFNIKYTLIFRGILNLISPKVLISLLIYHLGCIYKENENNIDFKFSYFVICILILFFNSLYGYINFANDKFINPPFFIVSSLSGIYINIYISKIIIKKYKNKLLHFIGQNTIYIMVFHFLSFKIVTLIIIKTYNLPLKNLSTFPVIYDIGGFWWILYSLLGLLVPLAIPLFLSKTKQNNK